MGPAARGALPVLVMLLWVGILPGIPPAARAQVTADTLRAAVPAPAPAPGEPGPGHWFYQGLPYGSDAMTHPLRLIVDGGFGIMQFDSRSNRLDDVDWERGWNRVWDDMTNPARAIEVGGWWDWIQREVLPFSANKHDAQY